jgi:beta-glucosidase
VVIVAGRPLILEPARLAKIDGLVAAWLPGSEWAGVADTLFGTRPCTGKLPVRWQRTVAQEPINVGDASYDRSIRSGSDPGRGNRAEDHAQAGGVV